LIGAHSVVRIDVNKLKMTENIHHTLKNERKSTSWWVKGDSLVGDSLLSGIHFKNSYGG